MKGKYSVSHKTKSNSHRFFDFASANVYLISLVTWKSKNLFGEIIDGKFHINAYGSVVQKQWLMSANIRPELILDEFIVMPNHFHGIVVSQDRNGSRGLEDQSAIPAYQPGSQSLGALVAGFKSACTIQINTIRHSPGKPVWQRSYLERRIHTLQELDVFRDYIKCNPHNLAMGSQSSGDQEF